MQLSKRAADEQATSTPTENQNPSLRSHRWPLSRLAKRALEILLAGLLVAPVVTAQSGPAISEPGPDDFAISTQGANGEAAFGGFHPAVAYNQDTDEMVAVWWGDFAGGTDNEFEIYGQRFNSAGAEVGADDFQISSNGTPDDATFSAYEPDIAYNWIEKEYLVVWHSDDNVGGLVDGEFEIWARRLDADAVPIGSPYRISDVGGIGSASFGAFRPQLVYNSVDNQYLVVWFGDDNANGQVDQEFEVFGQRLNGSGAEIGTNDFLISNVDGIGSAATGASEPALAFDAASGRYFVVWNADEAAFGLANDEFEIFGQMLDTAAQPVGSKQRISDMGPPNDAAFDAFVPAVAHDQHSGKWLVVWQADNDQDSVDDENEIWGRTHTAAGMGESVFRISTTHPTDSPEFDGLSPSVAADPRAARFLVSWQADEFTDDDFGIWARVVWADQHMDSEEQQISDAGNAGGLFEANSPATVFNTQSGEAVVVWSGEDINSFGTVDGEFDIYGQRLSLRLFADGFEAGDLLIWSSSTP